MGMDLWCDVCLDDAGCTSAAGKPGATVPFGGTVCANTTGNATVAAAGPSYPAVSCRGPAAAAVGKPGKPVEYHCWVFDLRSDPTEANNLGGADPALMETLLVKLDGYQESNVPCCSCTMAPDMKEMSLPPKDGYWGTFHDPSDLPAATSPLCDLLREPAANPPPSAEGVVV